MSDEVQFEEVEVPVVPASPSGKPGDVIDYYEAKNPRGRVADPGDEFINHLYCCDEGISICGIDVRQVDTAILPEDAGKFGDCYVCVKYDESAYHTCPLCGRF